MNRIKLVVPSDYSVSSKTTLSPFSMRSDGREDQFFFLSECYVVMSLILVHSGLGSGLDRKNICSQDFQSWILRSLSS